MRVGSYLGYHPSMHTGANQIVYDLSVAHQYQTDHTCLVRRLSQYLVQVEEVSESVASAAGKYLMANLKQNIQLVNSVGCLPSICRHLNWSCRKSITSLIRQKYPSEVNFYDQIECLKEVNYALIPPFLRIVSSLSSWFQIIIEQKSYKEVEYHEFQYILNSIYTLQRCKYDLQVQIQQSIGESVLCLYRILAESGKIYQQSQQNNRVKQSIYHSSFYFLANYDITQCVAANKYYFSTIDALIGLFKQQRILVHHHFLELMLPNLRKGTVQNANDLIVNNILQFLRKTIVNILLSCWSVQVEHFWLWKYKLFCDLLDIDDQRQYCLIDQIQQLLKELSRLFSC